MLMMGKGRKNFYSTTTIYRKSGKSVKLLMMRKKYNKSNVLKKQNCIFTYLFNVKEHFHLMGEYEFVSKIDG